MKYFISICFTIFTVLSYAQKPCFDCSCFVNKSMQWTVNVDDKGREYLIRGDSLKGKSYSFQTLFSSISTNSKIQLKLLKIQNKTAYIKIVNTANFTQLGHASVSWFLARLVFTLTENPNCNKIYLNFEEGDHTGPPGYFTRAMFEKSYVICN